MAQVKGMSAGASAVFAAEAGARAAQKASEAEAGQALLTAAVKQSEKEKKELEQKQEERSEERRENAHKDTPELSKQSKWFAAEGKFLEQENVKWDITMEEEIWKAFLNWLPGKTDSLSAQFEELSKLYLALLSAILIHTMGDEQAAQKQLLDEIMAEKLSLLLDADLKEIITMLEEAGQKETVDMIKASVYKQTTGENVSGRAASAFISRGRMASTGNARFFMPETASAGREETGVLYKRTGGRNIQVNEEFRAFKYTGEQQISQRNSVLSASPGREAGGAFYGRGTTYTGKELQAANRFASHVTGSGNLLKSTEITAKNDEVTGYLAAVTAIKGQVYAENAGRENALKVPVKSALNQFIDYYLSQKGVYKTYYYTTNVYERTRSAQKAMEEGLEYAYKQFLEKKNDEAYHRQAVYSKQAGFFHELGKNMSMEEDLRRGLLLLEKNWREFLKSIGEEDRKEFLVALQKYSIWGELIRPENRREEQKEKPRDVKRERMMMAQIIALAAIGAAYVVYKLLGTGYF